eukprot:gene20840-27672_t
MAPLPPVGGKFASSSGRKKKGFYKVLGDYSEFEEKLAETIVPPPPPEPDSIKNVDPMEFPEDVWNAATVSPDFGVAIIKAYREVAGMRGSYRQQLSTIRETRRMKELAYSGTGLGPVNTLKTGRTIAEAIKGGGEPRKLDNFNHFSKEWDHVTSSLASKTQRPDFELAMQRGPEWRARQEESELLERAIPINERMAPEHVFKMTLRDNWELMVPVGSTGIRSVIRDNPKAGLPRGLKKLFPMEPDADSLHLQGEAVEQQLESLAFNPITLEEVEHYLSATDPEAYEAYMAVKRAMEEERQAQFEADLAAQDAVEAARRAAGPQPGGVVELTPDRALLSVQAGESSSAVFTLHHKGTAAVQYTWKRQTPKLPPFANTDPQAPSCFYMTKQSGTLLPGHSQDFTINFKADVPGTYSEQWHLTTAPALSKEQEVVLSIRAASIPGDSSSIQRAALEAELVEQEKMRKVRAAVERLIEDIPVLPPPPVVETEEEKAANLRYDSANAYAQPATYYNPKDCATLMDAYNEAMVLFKPVHLANNPPPPDEKKKEKPKKGQVEEPTPPPPPPKFADEWEYSLSSVQELVQDLQKELAVVAEKAAEKLAMPAPAATAKPAEENTYQANMAAAKEQVATSAEWQATAADLASKVDEAAKNMRAPPDAKRMMRHVIRAMMGRIADTLESKLDGIKVDYNSRLAAQKAAAEAAAAADATDGASRAGTPLNGRQVDGAWYADKCKVGAKAVLKTCVPTQWEELVKERAQVGDVLEERIRAIDQKINKALKTADSKEGLEQLYWDRFALLREWVRLDIPSRGEFIH